MSRYTQISIHQGAIEGSLLGLINRKLLVDRNITTEKLVLDERRVDEDGSYPIQVTVRHESNGLTEPAPSDFKTNGATRSSEDGATEIIKAKYLVGCDGAHSWVRKQLEIPLEGKHTESTWGVMDIVALTDFRMLSLVPEPVPTNQGVQPTYVNHAPSTLLMAAS